MAEEILTIAQAAEYLQVCDKTIRRMIKANKLIASKVGSRTWRIKKSDIDAYLIHNVNGVKGATAPDESANKVF